MSRILVMDDEQPLRRVLRNILERAGHTVFEAPDGRQGMAIWRNEPIDIVVTDIFMPEKDGVEVILELKTAVTKPRVIAMSGGAQRGVVDLNPVALLLGADRVLLKPFDQQTFLETIQEAERALCEAQGRGLRSGAANQRRSPRLPVSFPVLVGDGASGTHAGRVIDISPEGCRIRCAGTEPPGQYFPVEMLLAGQHDRLKVDLAVKRWSREGDIGIEFVRMTPDDQARLRALIRSCNENALPPDVTCQPFSWRPEANLEA